jgi:hypothetical protein
MLPLFTGELETFQGTQESAMHDTCVILTSTITTDRYGKPVETFASGPPIPCGFRQGGQTGAGTDEVMQETEVVTADAVLRLAITTIITPRDRIVVTHRYGVAVPLEAYTVLGQPARGSSALVVKLELVTDGSEQ